MANPDYQFEKRQRDLAEMGAQEEMRRQKLAAKGGEPLATGLAASLSGTAASVGSPAVPGIPG